MAKNADNKDKNKNETNINEASGEFAMNLKR